MECSAFLDGSSSRHTDLEEAAQLLRASPHMQGAWYLERYPGVALLGMDPAEHYLRYGAALGRDPGASFSTAFYLATHPNLARDGSNPLLHHVRHGHKRTRVMDDPKGSMQRARTRVGRIRSKLMGLGFTRQPLEELALLRSDPDLGIQALSAWELALWDLLLGTREGWQAALSYLAVARSVAPDLEFRSRLVTVELLCHFFLGETHEAHNAYERAALTGEMTPDAMLAWANLQPSEAVRLTWINEVLRSSNIAPVTLSEDTSRSAYDRLRSAQILPSVTEGPKVSVLIAAYDAAGVITTSLRSMQEQTWRNLEIIVVDDASPKDEMRALVRHFAASDPRIRLVEAAGNGGAYVARNLGLDHATGDFITLHDADDWSHPSKIETQMRALKKASGAIACLSEQARATDGLLFRRLNGSGRLIFDNMSSFLWRRAPVREALGYWDTVRFSADSELIRRVEARFGARAVHRLATGPLSFPRDSATSIMNNEVTGMGASYFGARREYYDAQRHFHASGASLRYDGDTASRPFPVPPVMRPDRGASQSSHLDIVLAGDFRLPNRVLDGVVARVRELRAEGLRVGLVQAFLYDNAAADHLRSMHRSLRAEVDGQNVLVLVYGDRVTCDRLEIVTPGCDLADSRYAPTIEVQAPEDCKLATSISSHSEDG